MDKKIKETSNIKIYPEKVENQDKNSLLEIGRVISDLSRDIFNEKLPILENYQGLLALLLEYLDKAKVKELTNITDQEVFKYVNEVFNLLPDLAQEIFNQVKDLTAVRIQELFSILYKLQINDKEGIRVLTQVSLLLAGKDDLLKAAEIQDNYVKEILYNRPYFDINTKVKCILNASKSSEGTHIIKYGNLFLNTEQNGNISAEANQGGGESRSLGLFTGDMQFIDQYELDILDSDNQKLSAKLLESSNHGYMSYDKNIYNNSVVINRNRLVNGALFEKLEIINSSSNAIKLNIVLSSIIKDIFEVRGKVCNRHIPANIETDYDGSTLMNTTLDSNDTYGIRVSTISGKEVLCPKEIDNMNNKLIYEFNILPNTVKKINIRIQPLLNLQPYVDGEIISEPPLSFEEGLNLIENAKKTEFAKIKIEGDIPNIQKTVDKCLNDLNMLVSYINIDGKSYSYIDAGLPRYSALFGRDSIITALEIFPLNQDIAKDTLELLAKFQGKTFEERHQQELKDIKLANWPEAVKNAAIKGLKKYYSQKEESHGKILHELRVGEFAKTGIIPHSPYYGTVDATPLWLILFCEYYKWTKDREFLNKLFKNAEAAIDWINSNMGNGYLRFKGDSHSKVKIQNQGWKDAGDSIRHVINNKGHLSDPEYPIALAEVQGYVYKAFNLMSEIYQELGDSEKSQYLLNQSNLLKQNFNNDFWVESERFFTMALDSNNKSIPNITSNIGHCLAMGIVNQDKVDIIEKRLTSDEMFTGWGVRTLGSNCNAFDPISYHNGSVWVHDSAFVATGLSRDFMSIITKSLFEAANMFENNRLPELFGGFKRKQNDTYIQSYPEACAPQAWASGSLIWLLLKLLIITENEQAVLQNKVNIPAWLSKISIEGIKKGHELIDNIKYEKQV